MLAAGLKTCPAACCAACTEHASQPASKRSRERDQNCVRRSARFEALSMMLHRAREGATPRCARVVLSPPEHVAAAPLSWRQQACRRSPAAYTDTALHRSASSALQRACHRAQNSCAEQSVTKPLRGRIRESLTSIASDAQTTQPTRCFAASLLVPRGAVPRFALHVSSRRHQHGSTAAERPSNHARYRDTASLLTRYRGCAT